MANEHKVPTTRVQMDLGEKSMQRLKTLMERTEATSYAELMRNALRLYEAMIDRTDAGETIMVRKPSGEIVELAIF